MQIWSELSPRVSGPATKQGTGSRRTTQPSALLQSIGDTWNYINNAEKQLGFSVVFNFCFVWTSAVLTNVLYFQTYETAGWVLLPMCVWLTVAAKLVRDIRAINGKEPLLPRVSAISNIPP